MSDDRSQRNVLSPVVIMLAGLVLLAGSVASFFLIDRGDGAGQANAGPYRGVIFEAVAPGVEDGEARSRILLMGSMHVLRPEDHPLPESYEKAFKSADSVVFELIAEDEDGKAELIRKHSTYEDGSTMRNHLSDDVYQRASVAAEQAGFEMSAVADNKPHILAQALAGGVLGRAGFKRSWGVDTYFRNKAEEAEKKAMGLESIEEQLSVFSSLSDDRQEALLRHTLVEMERHPDYGLRGTIAWRGGNVELMAGLYADSRLSDPELASALFEDRHARWLPIIEQQLAPGKTLLVIVGAAHLCGDGSLIDLLRQRGYAIGQW